MSGLLSGVPQLIYPGKVFERRFNADSVAKAGAGLRLDDSDFKAEKIHELLERVSTDDNFSRISLECGQNLRKLGGTSKVISEIEKLSI
jgi:UDP:flavonoid glycosyltransferase YjiC (YdhE family)